MNPDELFPKLRNDLGLCLSRSCKKKGCSLLLASCSFTDIVIIDCDKYKRQIKFTDQLCDYILFCKGSDMTVAALELKGGRLDADTAFDQVKSGSQLAEQMAATCQVTEFYPIVLYGRNTNSMETRLFRKKDKRIAFIGRFYSVILEKCGAELRTIVNKQPVPPM